MASQTRRSRATSSSCPLRSKQVCIHPSWERRSPPRPAPLNVRPPVPIARTPLMNSARSCANAMDPPEYSSAAVTPGSQVCTAHGSG